MFPIESGLEPPRKRKAGRPDVYPWKSMAINDSFLVPDKSYMIMAKVAYLRGKKDRREYDCVREGNGVRVWRIS